MKKTTFWLCAIFVLSFSAYAQDTCATATALTPGVQQCDDTANYGDTFDDNTCLGNYDGGNDYLFSYTAGTTGETLQLDLTSSATWTGIAISEGCPEAGGGTCMGASTSSSGNESFRSDPLTAGLVYYIHISTWPTPQTADFCLDATLVTCVAPAASGTVIEDCANGQFSVDIDITDLGNASSVSLSNDGGVPATTGINTTGIVTVGPFAEGATVNITLEHDGDSACNVDLGSFTYNCPPPNDDFTNAIAINCSDNVTGSTAAATLDEDTAPDGFGADLDAPNVWFSYSGAAGDITLNLCPSGYDTSVLVYTGTSGNLTLVAANDDNNAACGGCCQSNLTFAADGSTTYYITVEGYNPGNTGNFDMTVSCVATIPPPANDECAAAEALTLAVSASGTTAGATANAAEEQPTCDPFGAIADVWYSVDLTGGPNDLTVNTTITGTSDQANVAIYNACGGLQADSVVCMDGNGGESVTANTLADGTYYIRVWSDGNAARSAQRIEGTFDIVADATLSTTDFENTLAFTYYPNPVDNSLMLKAKQNIQSISIYNMLGQEVFTDTPQAVDSEIDMAALPSGAYFVKVSILNTTETIRVIKN